jgi:hypothetical protein
MTAGAAPVTPGPRLAAGGLDVGRLARLLVRGRLRSLRNGLRVRGRGRLPVLAIVVGLFTSIAYVGLFAQAFSIICTTVDLAGQVTALAVVTLTIAFGSFTAKAASSEAILAGSPENEFLLARPVALPRLVVARCLAESATDPLGALFLFPVLLAATLIWRLPVAAVGLAVVVSLLAQLGISGLAQATQIAVVRFVPRARRRAVWMALGLLASLSLASLWMMGTRVLRAPASLASGLAPFAPLVARTPGALIVGPLAALERGSVVGALAALAALAAGTSMAVLLAAAVARRAGMQGWEEAGASWADATARPGATRGRVLTAATKDLALITRDRTRLLTLVSMPIIFVGVQLFGAAGWSWSTATLERVSHLAFSLTLYMATIGPLAHMQAERRSFWIMRTVPVSVGRLLAEKAKAWSIVIGGMALSAFAVLSLGTPDLHVGAWLEAATTVVVGAIGMAWLAIALAAGAADLSDESRPAIGPATIYVFMLIGGLYNVVLASDAATRVRGFVLYAFAIGAEWASGVHQATVCLDAEAARARRLSLGDGAAFVIAYALGKRGIAAAVGYAGVEPALGLLAANLGVAVVLGLALALYVARRPAQSAPRVGWLGGGAWAVAAGAAAGGLVHGWGFPGATLATSIVSRPFAAALVLPILLAEELLFRGVVQRGVAEALEPLAAAQAENADARARRGRAAALGAVVSVLLSVVASGGPGEPAMGILLVVNGAAALTYAVTGRVSVAFLTRVMTLVAAAALPLAP